MSFLDDLVNIAITTQSVSQTNPGFGVPLIADAHTRFSERARFYGDADAMLADGFLTTDPAYLAAVKLKSQKPSVPRFAIGRRANKPAMAVTLIPTATNSTEYDVTVNGSKVSYASDGTATVIEITAGLKTAIDALAIAGLTTTDNGAAGLVLSVAAGGWFKVSGVNRALMSVAQTHADPGIAADLAAILLETGEWYGFALTTQGAAEISAAAAWAQANGKQFCPASQDSAIATHAIAGATDIAATLKTAGYTYADVLYHSDNGEFAGVAWLGAVYPFDPGAATFKFKNLVGVTPDTLTETEITNIKAKNANYYTTIGGFGMTGEGTSAAGEFMDLVRDIDALHFDMQSGIAAMLAINPKIPYTDKGIGMIEGKVRASLARFVANGVLSDNPAPTVSAPKASDVNPSDKSARILRGVAFQATAAGAIHGAVIKGNVTA